MIVTIASQDKLSLYMASYFFIKMLGKEYFIAEMHSLMESDAISSFIEDSLKKTKNLIYCFYAKKSSKGDSDTIIPQKLKDISNIVIWFNLYSTDPIIKKDEDKNFERLYLEKWKKHVEFLKH